MVSKTIDFPRMEPELLISLIRSNDLVIHDEFKLFECISRWLTSRKAFMESTGEENIGDTNEILLSTRDKVSEMGELSPVSKETQMPSKPNLVTGGDNFGRFLGFFHLPL